MDQLKGTFANLGQAFGETFKQVGEVAAQQGGQLLQQALQQGAQLAAQGTQDEDNPNKNTTQYVVDTTMYKQTQIT